MSTGRHAINPVALAEGMAVARRLFVKEEYRPVITIYTHCVFSLQYCHCGFKRRAAKGRWLCRADIKKQLQADETQLI